MRMATMKCVFQGCFLNIFVYFCCLAQVKTFYCTSLKMISVTEPGTLLCRTRCQHFFERRLCHKPSPAGYLHGAKNNVHVSSRYQYRSLCVWDKAAYFSKQIQAKGRTAAPVDLREPNPSTTRWTCMNNRALTDRGLYGYNIPWII